jgi:hypothetical protein
MMPLQFDRTFYQKHSVFYCILVAPEAITSRMSVRDASIPEVKITVYQTLLCWTDASMGIQRSRSNAFLGSRHYSFSFQITADLPNPR